MHGYQMIQELSRRSGGAWTPSPGSIYPTLQMLEDEGLVASRQSDDGKRLYELTDAGRVEAGRAGASAGYRPWEEPGHGRGGIPVDFISAIRETVPALVYVATSGTDEQRQQVVTLLTEFREKLRAVVPEAGDQSGPWGRGQEHGPWGRSGQGWSAGLPGWLFGGRPGGPFGPGSGGWAASRPGEDVEEDAESLDDEGDVEV
jgi:DNA-binding PadR family transcriptional regulator